MTFLSRVKDVTKTTIDELGETTGSESKWKDPPTLPPPSVVFSDPIAAAMTSMAELAHETRQLSRDLQKAQVALRKQLERKQVSAIRSRADEIEKGAVVSAVLLAGAATAYTAGALAQSPASRTPPDGSTSPEATPKEESLVAKLGTPGGELLTRSADVSDRAFQATATRREADEKAAEYAARSADDAAKAHADSAQASSELAAKAFDAIRAVLQSRHAAESAVANIRG